MSIWFFSYGNDTFKSSKNRIKKQAEESGFFDKSFIYATKTYIFSERGAGYCLWKSYFIKQIFSQMNNGDYLFYLDAGCTINKKGRSRFLKYIQMLDKTKTGCLAFSLTGLPEYQWTNNTVFKYFNSNNFIKNSPQLVGGVLMFKKNETSCRLIDEYYTIAMSRPDLFSDDHNHDHLEGFRDHRHDQSVFSILRKNYHVPQIPDETYAERMLDKRGAVLSACESIPFLATRLRDRKKKSLKGYLLRLYNKLCQS